MRTRKIAQIIIIVFIFHYLIICLPYSTYADPVPIITIDIPEEVDINVKPGSSERAIVWGNITCESINPEDITVRLNAHITNGGAPFNFVTLLFDQIGNETKQFSVEFRLPIRTSSYTDSDLIVEGTWRQGGQSGDVEPVTSQINILPYSNAGIDTSPPLTVIPGESISFSIGINNTGNIDDIYKMEIVNIDSLHGDSVDVGPIEDISLKEGEGIEIEIPVQTHDETPLKMHRIKVIFYSTATEEPVEYDFSMYLRVKPNLVQNLIIHSPLFIIIILILVGIYVYKGKRKAVKHSNPK